MIPEEREQQQEQEISTLREQVAQRDGLIKQMQEQITVLTERVQALEAKLSKNSHNSHLPPSSDRFVRQPKSLRKKSGKKAGGQEGHPGTTLSFSCEPDEVIEHHVETCVFCQQDLHSVAPCGMEHRQVVDTPSPRMIVQEHRAEQKQCPHCQHITVASFPQGVQAPLQYGSNIGATAVYLIHQQLLPLARAAEVLKDLLGVHLSEGTLCELTRRCSTRLTAVEQHIKEALSQAEVIHQDETGLYVAGKRQWVHVTCTSTSFWQKSKDANGRQTSAACSWI